jgi:translation initiation factor IF-2
MIEDDVKQTRCTTCDAEHAYKGARVPRRKRTDAPAALYKEVLASMPDGDASVAGVPVPTEDDPMPASGLAPLEAANDDRDDEDASVNHEDPVDGAPEEPADLEEGPVHRPLIRATLPRPEGQKDARPLPEFTIRQAGSRGGNPHFRGGDQHAKMRGRGGSGSAPQGANGNRAHGGPRFAGARPAGQGRGGPGGRGAAPGFRSGPPRKKRSR